MDRHRSLARVFLALLANPVPCQEPPAARGPAPDRLAWWREARLGLFLHWGPVSLKGTELSWSRGGERRGRTGSGESCITLGTQWSWKPDDRIKSLEECLRLLLRCVGGDGNLLLNVGPMPSGEIEPRQAARLREIGAWLARHGEGVYGTRGGPWKPWAGGASTRKGSTVFLYAWQGRGAPLALPVLPRRLKAASCGELAVRIEHAADTLVLHLPPSQEPIQVVRLELDGPAAGIPAAAVGSSGSLAFDRPARASNVYRGRPEYGPAMAFDDDPETRWATDVATSRAWLEVDLGVPRLLGRAFLSEAYGRVRRFALSARIGEGLQVVFPPLTARHVRLEISEAVDAPTLWEVRFFPPE